MPNLKHMKQRDWSRGGNTIQAQPIKIVFKNWYGDWVTESWAVFSMMEVSLEAILTPQGASASMGDDI